MGCAFDSLRLMRNETTLVKWPHMEIRHYLLSFSKKCREIIKWVRNGYIIDLVIFPRVLSEPAIHNKSYYSPLSSERGRGRGFLSLQSLCIGAGGEAIPLFSFFALGLWERLFLSTKRKGRNQIPPLLNCMLASFTSFCWVELSPQQ